MKTTFDKVVIGQQFKWGVFTFLKIDDSYYPRGIPFNNRKPNCINIMNNHKCVVGQKAVVEVERILQ